MQTIKGPGLFIAQFIDAAPRFGTLEGLAAFAAECKFTALQIPTSSPKISVTPSLDSPTWSAMRMAWIIVAMSGLPADEVLAREDRHAAEAAEGDRGHEHAQRAASLTG